MLGSKFIFLDIDGVNDICVADMVCQPHNETGCEICYGPRIKEQLSNEYIKQAVQQYKNECLPSAEEAFHYQAEIWAGMKHFITWLEKKNQ